MASETLEAVEDRHDSCTHTRTGAFLYNSVLFD